MHLLVMAKAPVAGRVKTRLSPPLTESQAATYAEAALVDTLTAVAACDVDERILALEGAPADWLPEGFRVVPQAPGTLNERLARAWAATDGPGFQIGMDTPQVTVTMLESALASVAPGRALLGPALDGGWWGLGLAGADPAVFDGVTMSQSDTGAQQRARLEALGYSVVELGVLVDVDEYTDAVEVASSAPNLYSSRVLQSFDVDSDGLDATSTSTTGERATLPADE